MGEIAVLSDRFDVVAVFTEPSTLDDILAKIEAEARAEAPDTSTAKGRKAIASLAHKVARSKTALDEAGKKLNADKRAEIDAVDSDRRKLRERLDALKAEIRAPLDRWETEEADRRAAVEARKKREAEQRQRNVRLRNEARDRIAKSLDAYGTDYTKMAEAMIDGLIPGVEVRL